MLKSLKPFLSVFLALTLLLAGCAGGDKTNETDGQAEKESAGASAGEKETSGTSADGNGSAGSAVDTTKLAAAKYGDIITVGAFEQDGNENNGKEPIEWMVVTKMPGKALVVSKYVLERMPFESDADVNSVTYPDSTVRSWLNGDFYQEAFTEEEKAFIPLTNIQTAYVEDYERHTTDSDDHVFLLSYNEVNKYIASKEGSLQIASPTETVKATGIYVWDNSGKENPTPGVGWMLRDSADSTYRYANVDGGGYIARDYGDDINDRGGIRPAMWLVYNKEEMDAYESDGVVPEDAELNQKLSGLQVGDKVEMGIFDPTSRMYGNVHAIIWTVLDIQNGKALLFADGNISSLPLNDDREAGTCYWEMCSLRTYLNSDEFLDWTFMPAERAKILLTAVHTEDAAAWQRSGGPDTEDHVFLASKEEIEKYYPAKEDAALAEENYWLRSADFVEDYMSYVYAGSGGVGSNNAYAYSGVRPMMWIDIG